LSGTLSSDVRTCIPLAAHSFDGGSWRSYESYTSLRAFLCKVWILAQLPLASATYAMISSLQGVLQTHIQDVYPDIPALWQFVLFYLHQGMQKGRRD
jgi:hypothetical protein